MSAVQPLCGVLPVFQTPYLDDESIDWETLAVEIEWLLAQGADGVVMAMVSELLRLSHPERRQMAEHIGRCVSGRASVVISVGAESTHTAVELARHAQGCGATALMAIPPTTVRADESQLAQYYRRIIQAVTLPVIVQDASGYIGMPLTIQFQVGLMEEFGPERVYFKPETPPLVERLIQLRAATDNQARVFEGSGGIALRDCHRHGIVGTMPGAEIIDAIMALWRALKSGDTLRADRLSQTIGKLVGLQQGLDGFLAVEKHLLVRRGIFRSERIRGPVAFQLNEATRNEVNRLFDQLQNELN